ncbi:MAG TPA: tRNA pseudouridine(38-40) synthase TruA [Kiritimatiellia bacterium]|nr:tRNA pseudouridine(38-40) synthase TruA [Kiritimatiellia bacterium]
MKPTESIQRYKAVVAYDGHAFAGWQVQPGKTTIQGELERAVYELTRQEVRVFASGRTDTGVHAVGQVIHMDLQIQQRPDQMMLGLNRFLPDAIRVMKVARVKPDFDARMTATGKEYRYFIWNDFILPPHLRFYRTHVRKPLDLEAMRRAAGFLEGTHDFAGFSTNPGYDRGGTVRRIDCLSITRKGKDVTLIARGEGFLYRMVRSLAGFFIRVGVGDLPPEMALAILAGKERTARVPTASPNGLFLWKVFYPKSSRGERG